MAAFIIRRLIWTIPVILLVILMTFVMMKQIGGNPFRRTERPVPPQVQENLERKFGLDKPWYEQYFVYVKNTFTFDFGPTTSPSSSRARSSLGSSRSSGRSSSAFQPGSSRR